MDGLAVEKSSEVRLERFDDRTRHAALACKRYGSSRNSNGALEFAISCMSACQGVENFRSCALRLLDGQPCDTNGFGRVAYFDIT